MAEEKNVRREMVPLGCVDHERLMLLLALVAHPNTNRSIKFSSCRFGHYGNGKKDKPEFCIELDFDGKSDEAFGLSVADAILEAIDAAAALTPSNEWQSAKTTSSAVELVSINALRTELAAANETIAQLRQRDTVRPTQVHGMHCACGSCFQTGEP